MAVRRWRPRLGAEAERDLNDILRWTASRFGVEQARRYRRTILLAIRELEGGPDALGSRARDEIMPGLRTLHVARQGRRGRHFLMYRASTSDAIDILRILHDGMDTQRHVPPPEEEP